MTDSNCTRAGYDRTGRYHVPMWTPPVPPREAVASPDHVSQSGNFPDSGNMADQCSYCRAAPGQPHNPECCNVAEPVHVPLPLQERLLEAFLLDEWTVVVAAFMERHRGEIVDMAFQRLRDGHAVYGSTMYGWEPERRTNEAIEEVADLLAYLSSGEVE